MRTVNIGRRSIETGRADPYLHLRLACRLLGHRWYYFLSHPDARLCCRCGRTQESVPLTHEPSRRR